MVDRAIFSDVSINKNIILSASFQYWNRKAWYQSLDGIMYRYASLVNTVAADVPTSVAVRYKKSISIIETNISIDYRYIDFLASYFIDRSRGLDRVGDNWRTVNTSANLHISDQLKTEYAC